MLSSMPSFTNISLKPTTESKKNAQVIVGYRKSQKSTVALLVMAIISSFPNTSIAYTNFLSSAAFIDIRAIKGDKGTSADDIIYGTNSDDRLNGKNGNDTLYGLAGDDRLTGGNGDDILDGGAGSDILIGGNGNDSALYPGVFTDYTLVKESNSWVVTNSLGEVDKVQTVEELHFSDRIIYLDGRNNAPTAIEDQLNVNEDDMTATEVNVTSNDSDFDNDPLTISNLDTQNTLGLAAIVDPTIGSIAYHPNGQFESLALGEISQDTLTYEITDGNGGISSQAVKVNITGANDIPTANDLTIFTDEGVSIDAVFIANDIDNDDDTTSLSYNIIEAPAFGTVSLRNGNQFSYDPGDSLNHLNAGEQHEVTFDYSVTDRHGAISQKATVTITVYGISNLPAPMLKLRSPLVFSKVGDRINVSVNSSIRLSNVASATLTNGNIVVVWGARHEEDTAYTADEVYGQLYNSQGMALGSNFKINTFTLGGQQRPDITALAGGGFVVAWESDQENGSQGVYSQQFDAMGAKIGGETHVNTYTDSFQYDVNVGSLTNGGHVALWTSPSTDGSDFYKNIYGQIFDDNGQSVGDELLINSHLPNHQELASVTGLENGGFVATWRSYRQDSYYSSSIFAQVFDSYGNKIDGEFRVNTYAHSDQTLPDIVAIDGGFIVTWASMGQDGSSYGIYSHAFALDGKPIGLETQVNTITQNSQTEPSITSLTDGGYVITWRASNLENGYPNRISGQRYDQFGNCVGDEFLVDLHDTEVTTRNFSHDVTATNDGGFLVTWMRLDDESNLYDVLAQEFGPTKANISPDGSLPLNMNIGHEDQSGDITLTVLVKGLPAGSILSAGVLNPDGSWALGKAALEGLTLSLTPGFAGELNLTITAVAKHKDTGETSTTSQPLSFQVQGSNR